ncbi:TIGR02234 family membrane protein [Streptomyces sp. NPDC056121]|uniref:TIGR02234 family membrane protein n=2 Tax=Streptomyces TaxID=1883 RepID=A0AAU1UDN4_9ACTN|nr:MULTISPECIES: TIGR02234 family membrane protein [Streptomyces]WSE14487.1 TIGR02234 family membrane protein [Streptomyces sp. NBC_01397]MCX4646038.1 TIGR02234 family membrane protein [Streptomyces sp. NBC_01446]MCX5318662.1 TIGR02234 family membrane protein [Streptomyces sp. NBC_00120]MCX5436743.1 TIGR02234 family membrane protein [Streptomyces sp. NBC_00063]RFC75661.1 TIGR02234 family membrane protein [Streptomyces sp. AcE210]
MTSAVPSPRTEAGTASPETAAARNGRRSLAAALLFGAVGAAVALLSSRQEWASGSATVPGGSFPLAAKGSDVTGVPAALAIVGLAALVAVFAVRRAGRTLVAGLLALSGAGAVVAAVLGAGDSAALDEKAAEVSGNTAATIGSLGHTVWPYVGAAGGALILLAGLLALRYGRSWPSMGGRYERDGTPRPRKAARPVDPERPEELWKALDRGEDPTHEA